MRNNFKERNGNWKGNKVTYNGLHMWIKRNTIKPLFCSKCKLKKKLQIVNLSGAYKRNLEDW